MPHKKEKELPAGSLVDPERLEIAPTLVNRLKPKREMSEKQKANVEKLIALTRERARQKAIERKGLVEEVENMPRDKLLLEVKAKREYVKKTDEERLEELRQKVMNKKLQDEHKQKKLGAIKMPVVHEEEKKEEKKVEPTPNNNNNNNVIEMFKMFQQFQSMNQPSQPIVINNGSNEKKPRKKRATKKKFVSDTEDTTDNDTDFYTETETETDTDYETVKKTNYRLKKLQQIESKLQQYQRPPTQPTVAPPRNPYSVFG